MRKAMTCTLIGAAIIAAVPVAVAAQEAGSRSTREFVQAAGESDQFEILESRTVLAQSTDPQVRAFAQQMIHDHGETSRMLQQATTSAGLKPPPMSMSDDQAHLLGALQSLKGAGFDQAFAAQQALAHHSALVVEQGYAATGDTPAVRQVAAAAAQVIAAHLAMAEQLHARLGSP